MYSINVVHVSVRTRMLQLRNMCINPSDFEVVKVISRGHFSEVSVVKEKGTCRVYVSRKLHKADILDAQEVFFREIIFSIWNLVCFSLCVLFFSCTFNVYSCCRYISRTNEI